MEANDDDNIHIAPRNLASDLASESPSPLPPSSAPLLSTSLPADHASTSTTTASSSVPAINTTQQQQQPSPLAASAPLPPISSSNSTVFPMYQII